MYRFIARAIAVFSLGVSAASAAPFTSIVSFGDSLSDVGNILAATTASPIQALQAEPIMRMQARRQGRALIPASRRHSSLIHLCQASRAWGSRLISF